MSLNIFQIWDSIGRITPFAVRRANWSEEFYTIVENVECETLPYGKAFGYPTINGQYSTHYEYNRKWKEYKIIPGCGTYQWELVENADISKYKDGLKASEKTVKAAYTISSQFYFGKYQGKTVEEVFRNHSDYIEWAINNVAKFFLTPEAFDYLDKLKTDFKFKNKTKLINNEKIIKLPKA